MNNTIQDLQTKINELYEGSIETVHLECHRMNPKDWAVIEWRYCHKCEEDWPCGIVRVYEILKMLPDVIAHTADQIARHRVYGNM